jgi:hypothetical protein
MIGEPWSGHWGWVCLSGTEGLGHGQFEKSAGLIGSAVFGLPPEFVAESDRLNVWATVNGERGTMLDIFEDDELSEPSDLFAVAGALRSANWADGRDLADRLAGFIETAAQSNQSLEFWL